jgi:hydrogenase maturation protease
VNTQLIDAIAKAVLYEGYMLYPYRPSSVKNRQRFNFGVLYPKPYSEAQTGSDAWRMQTECLVQGAVPAIEVRVRFLKLVARTVREQTEPACARSSSASGASVSPQFDCISEPWQEAIECEETVPVHNLDAFTVEPFRWNFVFPAKEETEFLRDQSGRLIRTIERKQDSVCGFIEIKAARAGDHLFKLQVRVENLTRLEGAPDETSRDSALMRSLVSAHTLLGVADGQFVSLLEPPEELKTLATSCENIGAWPVLVGAEGERDTMLASPIILYDYPQIAPESPGDLFDGTEIDEILALRIMTMTDDEKREMRSIDDRARRILERTEALPMEHLAKLHGTLRELRSLKEEMP